MPNALPAAVDARTQIHWLSRSVIVAVVAISMGTLVVKPAGVFAYAIDILFRAYVVFLGTVMAHEAIHGNLGRSRASNLWWGRIALLPAMVPFTNFRKTHLLHHAFTNDPARDPDFFVRPRNVFEIPLRAVAMPHHWFFWLWKRGRIDRNHIEDLLLNYAGIFSAYALILLVVGPWRLALGVGPALILVSVLLWHPFAAKTHEGFSTGSSESRSYNYYGRFMYWFSLGLSMHRKHHSEPRLAWIELKKFVEQEDGAGFWRRLTPRLDMKGALKDRLSPLDLVLAVMDSPRRRMDFGIILHLNKAPTLEALRSGARSARSLYPVSGSVIEGKRWTRIAVPGDGVTSVSSAADAADEVEAFFASPLDPKKHAPIQQLVVAGDPDGRTMLVTRAHHAGADGVSVAMWLRHQFRVATGLERPATEPAPFTPVVLRRHASPVRKSPFGYRRPAQGVWTRSDARSGSRCWLTIELAAANPGVAALATAALETLAAWNRAHGAASRRIGLWFPVNVRQRRMLRFGNGASRVRIYPRYPAGASFAEKRREIQRQIRQALRHGEWAVAPRPAITRLPLVLAVPLLRLYLSRPWLDVGTIPFTHVGESSAALSFDRQDAVFQDVEKIECIGQLHERHALAMNGVSYRGKTWLTFIYDPGRLTHDDIRRLADLYTGQVALAERVS